MTTTQLIIGDLKVAHASNPIGIDDCQPLLSWRVLSPRTGEQSAYRILVASSAEQLEAGVGDLWDSGKVFNSCSLGVAYGGLPLASRQRCYWQVTVWDADGQPSCSGETAFWEMGLLNQEDWRGEWLAAETADERDQRSLKPLWFGDVPGPATFLCSAEIPVEGEVELVLASDGIIVSVTCNGETMHVPAWSEHAFGNPPPLKFAFFAKAGQSEVSVVARSQPNPLFKQTIALSGWLKIPTGEGGVTHCAIGAWETRTEQEPHGNMATRVADRAHLVQPASAARLLRYEFDQASGVKSARLYVAALGGYDIHINGQRVGIDQLQAEPTEYRDFIPYRTYDVSDLILSGPNAIAATVADGFYASYTAPEGRYLFGPPPRRLRAMLLIEGTDGPTQWVVTGSDWRSAPSCITQSEIYNGEHVDFRLDQPGWDRSGFDDSHWEPCWSAPRPSGKLVAPLAPPIRATASIAPITIRRAGDARFIVDFGQNFAGRVQLRACGVAGQLVVIRHAETLDEAGELDVRNLRAADATDRYILRDNAPIMLEPRFTYHGFRYAEISGVENLDSCDIEGKVLSSNLLETGQITVDNTIVQKLWQNTIWSQRSNFVGIPTDCPQRDERLGWTGDAQIFWDTAAYNMDVASFTRSYCREMRAAQRAGGAFPVWAPMARFAHPVLEMSTPGWADAGVELPYVSYLHSGDRTIIDENWDAMERYVASILAVNPDGIWSEERGADFGDHLALDGVAFGPPTTPLDLIGTAMLARSTARLVAMAAWTKRKEQGAYWNATFDKVRSAFARSFIDDHGVVGNGSQTSYILALRFGLVPETIRPLVARNLAEAIRARGTLLTTGFLGTPLALDVLADIGEVELAYSLLLRTEFPSWGYMVAKGATTIWERWNGDTGDVAMNSFNHYALGAVCAFLYRRMCGIEPLAPGFGRIRVAPLPDRRIPAARASYASAMGEIISGWAWEKGLLNVSVTIPPNAQAVVVLPGQAIKGTGSLTYDPRTGNSSGEVGPGDWCFVTQP
jgi:alpha-L-rhamnosidase